MFRIAKQAFNSGIFGFWSPKLALAFAMPTSWSIYHFTMAEECNH
jgi:hypothetical protein